MYTEIITADIQVEIKSNSIVSELLVSDGMLLSFRSLDGWKWGFDLRTNEENYYITK